VPVASRVERTVVLYCSECGGSRTLSGRQARRIEAGECSVRCDDCKSGPARARRRRCPAMVAEPLHRRGARRASRRTHRVGRLRPRGAGLAESTLPPENARGGP